MGGEFGFFFFGEGFVGGLRWWVGTWGLGGVRWCLMGANGRVGDSGQCVRVPDGLADGVDRE